MWICFVFHNIAPSISYGFHPWSIRRNHHRGWSSAMEQPSERCNRPGFRVSSSFEPLEGHHQWWAAEGWGFDMEIAGKLSQTYFLEGINSHKFQTSKYNFKKNTYHIFPYISIIFHPQKISDSGSGRFSTSRSESRVLVFSPRENREGSPWLHRGLGLCSFQRPGPGIRIHPQDGETTLKLGNEKTTKVGFFFFTDFISFLGGGFNFFLYLHCNSWGNDPIWRFLSSLGWNHQLENLLKPPDPDPRTDSSWCQTVRSLLLEFVNVSGRMCVRVLWFFVLCDWCEV